MHKGRSALDTVKSLSRLSCCLYSQEAKQLEVMDEAACVPGRQDQCSFLKGRTVSVATGSYFQQGSDKIAYLMGAKHYRRQQHLPRCSRHIDRGFISCRF